MSCKTISIGSIKIRMHDGIVRTLSNVLHVPDLKKNLISSGTLDSNNYKFSAESGVLRVSKGSCCDERKEGEYPLYPSR